MKSGLMSLWLLIIFICHYMDEGIAKNESIVPERGNRNDSQLDGDGWMLHNPGGGPLDSRCPCLTRDICPRAFGISPVDILLLGRLPICQDESTIRCCGASMRVITQMVVISNKENQTADNLNLRALNDTEDVIPIQDISLNGTELKISGKSFDEMLIMKAKRNEDIMTNQAEDNLTVNLSALNETDNIIQKQEKFVNDTELKPSGRSAEVIIIPKAKKNDDVMTGMVENLNENANVMKGDEKSKAEDMEIITIGTNDSEHQVNTLELKGDTSDLNDEDILSEHNTTNASTAEYSEYFKPEMLMFQLDDAMGVVEETMNGNLMIVTPIPLSPMQKYQQQTMNKGSASDVTDDNVSAASHISLHGVMHVTHRPDKEVMIVTPQPIAPLMEKGDKQSSNYEKNNTHTEDGIGRSAVHGFSNSSSYSPGFRQMNSSQTLFRAKEKQENIDYRRQYERFGSRIILTTEIPEKLLTSHLRKMEGPLSKASIKVDTTSAKNSKEQVSQDSNYSSIKNNSTASNIPLIKVESLPLSKQTLLKDVEEMLSKSNLSSQPLRNNENYMEILRIVRESQILKDSAKRPLQPRGRARPRWSPVHIQKKQPEMSNFRNLTQASLSSQINDKNHYRTGVNHKFKNAEETSVVNKGNLAEVTTEKMKNVQNKTSQNQKNNSVLQFVTENVRQITKLPSNQVIPMTQIVAPDVAINTGHLQQPTKPAFVNQRVFPMTDLKVSQQNKLVLSKEFEGQEIVMNNPMQVVHASKANNKAQDGFTFLHQELLSLFSDLKMWEKNNANLPLKNNPVNPINRHVKSTEIKEVNITPISFRNQEVRENLKSIIPKDEVFGRRINPRHTLSATPSRLHFMPSVSRKQ